MNMIATPIDCFNVPYVKLFIFISKINTGEWGNVYVAPVYATNGGTHCTEAPWFIAIVVIMEWMELWLI